jgi:hypothetical protein
LEILKQTAEGSEVWQETNRKVDALYELHNRKPSEEEYQSVRALIFYKAVLQDEKLMKVMSDIVWESLQ